MAGKESAQTKYLRDLVAEFPNLPKQTIARIAYHRNPQWWTSLDTCRTAVRRICGAGGTERRARCADKSQYRKHGHQRDGCIELPPPLSEYADEWRIRDLPRKKKWLILCDVHVPFHDEKALTTAINHGRDQGCDAVLVGGDFMDFYRISRYDKEPDVCTLKQEREIGIGVLGAIREAFPDALLHWLAGNHEERWEAFLIGKAAELWGLSDFELPHVMRLEAFDCDYTGDKQPLRIGKLHILHGHEFASSWYNPVNPARGLFLRGGVTAIAGHNHQTSFHQQKLLNETQTACWSVGTLGMLHPKFRPVNPWNHGFAVCDDTGASWKLQNYRIGPEGELET